MVVCVENLLYKEVGLRSTLLCIMLSIYGYLQFKHQPFINVQLNRLSLQSTISQLLTVLLQLCIYDENTKNLAHFEIFAVIIIIIVNFSFLSNAAYLYMPEIFTKLQLKCLNLASYVPLARKCVSHDQFILKTKTKMRWNRIKVGTLEFIFERSQSLKDNPNKLLYYKYLQKVNYLSKIPTKIYYYYS